MTLKSEKIIESASNDLLVKKWIAGWKNAANQLAKIRNNKIRTANPCFCIQVLEDSFLAAINHHNSCSHSGLIEQQKLFSKLRK